MSVIFYDFPDFNPNLKPFEMLQAGIFGGTYFRDIYSSITKQNYKDTWKELPDFWIINLPDNFYKSNIYDENVNKYKIKCGSDLRIWEKNGWINEQDPYGWFQWYCRFYCGRRTDDDERQIKRWIHIAGPKGRIKKRFLNVINKQKIEDETYNPALRQTLLHWGVIF